MTADANPFPKMKPILVLSLVFCSCAPVVNNNFRPLKAVIVENAKQAKEAGATKLTLNLTTVNGAVAGATIPTGFVPISAQFTRSDSQQIVVEITDLQKWPHKPGEAKLKPEEKAIYEMKGNTFIPLETPAAPLLR